MPYSTIWLHGNLGTDLGTGTSARCARWIVTNFKCNDPYPEQFNFSTSKRMQLFRDGAAMPFE